MSRASFDVAPVLYAAGSGDESGAELTTDVRDELLRKCAAGEYVAVDIDVLAYEQRDGVRNRNNVRFRNESLIALGASGKGKPFLRDHEQWDSMSVAGKIITSKTTKLAEGQYEMRMRVRLTAPWAVELALRGLLFAVSIGWEAEGPIECSTCGTAIYTKCYHWPGDRVTEMPQADGTKKFVWDRNGVNVVEWIYTKAALKECSICPIGGVKLAGVEGVRAALAAAGLAFPDDEVAVMQSNHSHVTGAVKLANVDQVRAALAARGFEGSTKLFALDDVVSAITETKFAKGDRVVALVDHMEGMKGMAGSIAIANAGAPPYYGIKFDDQKAMPGVHKWLAEDEIKSAPKKSKPGMHGVPDEESPNPADVIATLFSKSTPPAPTPEGKPMSKLDAALAAHTELSADERKAFAAKLAAELEPTLATLAAEKLAADPVVHTTKDGTAIRKSDGAVALMLAKQSDAQAESMAAAAATLATERAAAQLASLRNDAKALLADKGMHGTLDVHAAILGAVRSIPDDTLRAACVQSLTAWTAGGQTKSAPGINPELSAAPTGDGLANWNTALAAFAEKNAIKDPLVATQKFLGTPEGLAAKRAYDATRAYGTPAR